MPVAHYITGQESPMSSTTIDEWREAMKYSSDSTPMYVPDMPQLSATKARSMIMDGRIECHPKVPVPPSAASTLAS